MKRIADWLAQGAWVPKYTRRGAPFGVRWRTNGDRILEWACGIAIALAPFVAMVAPIIHWELTR